MDTDLVILDLLYLWTRDAKIAVDGSSDEDTKYLDNQVPTLGNPTTFSDETRERWCRQVLEDLKTRLAPTEDM